MKFLQSEKYFFKSTYSNFSFVTLGGEERNAYVIFQ